MVLFWACCVNNAQVLFGFPLFPCFYNRPHRGNILFWDVSADSELILSLLKSCQLSFFNVELIVLKFFCF